MKKINFPKVNLFLRVFVQSVCWKSTNFYVSVLCSKMSFKEIKVNVGTVRKKEKKKKEKKEKEKT